MPVPVGATVNVNIYVVFIILVILRKTTQTYMSCKRIQIFVINLASTGFHLYYNNNVEQFLLIR